MKEKVILKKINRRRKLLNLLLILFSPTNIIIVKLSQNLDLYIHRYQNMLAQRYRKKLLRKYNLMNRQKVA